MNERRALLWSALLVLLVRIVSAPRTLWELDEVLFAEAVVDFDPLRHHPHPPGYPLLVALGKTVAIVVRDPFVSLVVLNIIASVVSFVALARAFEEISADRRAGIMGSLLVHLSPALLVHGPLALSDPPALMFLSLALFTAARFEREPALRDAILTGIFASAAIGSRPQYAVPIVPLFLFMVVRQWSIAKREQMAAARIALAGLAAFTVTCLAWLIPLVAAVGGLADLLFFEFRQASYVAQHDAVISRSGWTAADLTQRFIAHPWGPKWLSLPVLSAAAAGAFLFVRKRERLWAAVPLVGIAVIQLVFCLSTADPADGVRYVLPSLYAVGFFATTAIVRLGPFSSGIVATLAVASGVYAYPVIAPRVVSPSPPAQAAAYITERSGRDTVVLFESSLRPHAEWLLRDFEHMPWDRGVAAFAKRPDVPLVGFADGHSQEPGTRTFSWPESDAYGKLTRNHYHAVSVVPVPAQERFRVLRGVYALERDPHGIEWRWLEPVAALELPDLPSKSIVVELRLPPEHPRDSAAVEVAVGSDVRLFDVRKGSVLMTTFVDTPGVTRIDLRCRGAVVPASIEGSLNRDPRTLCVQLAGVSQR
ncbi:MAG: ArnT family glycosyltransferase [Thermoanaerobaculia bacterium]